MMSNTPEKYVLIVENASESLKKFESATAASNRFLLSGSFTEFDIENRNKRKYTAENFIPHMHALLEKKSKLGVVYGEYDHPDVFDLSCKNLSHAIEDLKHNEAANRIDGTISLLSNHWGKEARAIINDGYPLFVSSRAAGVTEGNGQVYLKELFTYDIVCDPGFATSRVTPPVLNESLGFGSAAEDVQYRIYEMNDSQVNNLFGDNKNDMKTKQDLNNMEEFLKNEMAKYELKIAEMISNNSKYAPEQVKELVEKLGIVTSELSSVKEYLAFLQPKMTYLIGENTKLAEENKKLNTEVSENIIYSNMLATNLKKLNTYALSIDERLSVGEKMIEYVAEHAKANIMFSEDIGKNLDTVSAMLEYVAENVKTNAEFLEYVAEETKTTQDFSEYIANEKYKDEIFLNYIGEKVDGIIDYTTQFAAAVKENTPLKEGVQNSIHSLQSPEDFLGITEERTIVNKINEEFPPMGGENDDDANATPDATATPNVDDAAATTSNDDATAATTVTDDAQTATATVDEVTPIVDATNTATADADATVQPLNISDETDANQAPLTNQAPATVDDLMDALVKITATEETGIVMEVTPEGKIIIQKTGSEDLVPHDREELEVVDTDTNLTEKIANVLKEIKNQRVLANAQPHFFTFLTEAQVADFKALDRDTQDNITLALSESEYFTAEEVLAKIGKVLNEKGLSYEDRLIANIPTPLKEAWNLLGHEQKVSVITESKYFNLTTQNDIANFFSTRQFAKAVTSPEATLIKESFNNDEDKLSDGYADAFLKSYNSL